MARKAFRRVGQPRQMIWIGAGLGATTISSAATLLQSLNAAGLALRPFTVVRTHLGIQYTTDQAAAAEFTQGALGVQVVTESAAAAGIAAVPTPLTETDADYFVYKPVFQDFVALTLIGFNQLAGDAAVHWVDSKAMRKVGVDDDIVFTLEQRTAVGSIIAIEGRMLIKLH